MATTPRTKAVIAGMTLAAASASGYAWFASHNLHAYYALAVLALAAATSRMKVKLPGINGNMSVNLPFLLTAVVHLSAAEAVAISIISTVVQCWPAKDGKFRPHQVIFNLSMMSLASCLASVIFHAEWWRVLPWRSSAMGLALATLTLFLGQTVPVAAIVALSEGKAILQIWGELAQLSFPYYVVSAGITSMVQTVSSRMGWGLALAVFPVMYAIHRSYSLYFGRMAETLRPPVLVRAARAGA